MTAQRWIALLRGVNVGGRNKLPMAELRTVLCNVGFEDVRTYIQSGNIVLQSREGDASAVAAQIEDVIERRFGFRPRTSVLAPSDIDAALSANPWPDVDNGAKVHFWFLSKLAEDFDSAQLQEAAADDEDFRLIDRVIYLHAPGGIGRSKLVEYIGRLFGSDATARNLRTVQKLAEMAAV